MKTKRIAGLRFVAVVLSVLGALICAAQDAPTFNAISTRHSSPWSLAPNIVPGHNFDGLGQNSFGFNDPFIPPDTAGAVGTTQYVEWVNTSLAVFNKGTGEILSGPTSGNNIFTPMGSPCASNNSGQPVVEFDKLAKRWVIGQLVLAGRRTTSASLFRRLTIFFKASTRIPSNWPICRIRQDWVFGRMLTTSPSTCTTESRS
jgi:hypothetical protein